MTNERENKVWTFTNRGFEVTRYYVADRSSKNTPQPEILWTRLTTGGVRGYPTLTIRSGDLEKPRFTITFPTVSHDKLIELAQNLPAGKVVEFSLSQDMGAGSLEIQKLTKTTKLVKITE